MGAIALPATPATVAAYLAALADSGLEVMTISRRAAAIACAHTLAGFEPPINESVKAVMRGIRRRHCELGTGLWPTSVNETGWILGRNFAVACSRRRQEVGLSVMHRARLRVGPGTL